MAAGPFNSASSLGEIYFIVSLALKMQNPICEPFTSWPVKFDINQLIKEFQPEEKGRQVDEDKSPRDFLHLPDNNWVVLPSFKYQFEHLTPYLSCRQSKYMRCRFQKFLDNVPSSYVTISLYGSNVSKWVIFLNMY